MNVGKEIATLRKMGVAELRGKYAEVFGEPTRAGNKDWLVKRITWRLQSLAEGDLSERACRRAAELASDADLRMNPPKALPAAPAQDRTTAHVLAFKPDDRLPPPGTVLTRKYKGDVLQVKVLPHGFEYEGEVYKLLNAVANTSPF